MGLLMPGLIHFYASYKRDGNLKVGQQRNCEEMRNLAVFCSFKRTGLSTHSKPYQPTSVPLPSLYPCQGCQGCQQKANALPEGEGN